MKRKYALPLRIVFGAALFLSCNRLYFGLFTIAREIAEESNLNCGRLPGLLLRDDHPCATLSITLLFGLLLSYCISKRQATRTFFAFFILPIVSLSITLAFSVLVLYPLTSMVPILCDLHFPGLVDAFCILLLTFVVVVMEEAARSEPDTKAGLEHWHKRPLQSP